MESQIDRDGRRDYIVKVIGIGCSGCNTINRIIESGVGGMDFIAINTDKENLKESIAATKLHIGMDLNLTNGKGADGDPNIGVKAARESIEKIKESIACSDFVFLTAGMGGGTGTGATAIITKVIKEMSIPSIALITTPFTFEGKMKKNFAEYLTEFLQKYMDLLVIVSNDGLLQVSKKDMGILELFSMVDKLFIQIIAQCISDISIEGGKINIDFTEAKAIVKRSGIAYVGNQRY